MMHNHRIVVPVAVLAIVGTAHAQTDQREIAQRVLASNLGERNRAIDQAQAIEPMEIEPQLRAALIMALEREARLHREHAVSARYRASIPPLEDPEFVARVSRLVVALEDPATIPALASALAFGTNEARALARFGDRAADAVLGIAEQKDMPVDWLNGALISLRFMVEGAPQRPLSPGTVMRIRRVADQRLNERLEFASTLWRAIDLAIALNDSELRRTVQAIADSAGEVLVRGIADPDIMAQTRKRAADRLSGAPPLPRP